MGNPEFHDCFACGHRWCHGQSGEHDCKGRILQQLNEVRSHLAAVELELSGAKLRVAELEEKPRLNWTCGVTLKNGQPGGSYCVRLLEENQRLQGFCPVCKDGQQTSIHGGCAECGFSWRERVVGTIARVKALLQDWQDRSFAQPHNVTLDGYLKELKEAIDGPR